MFELKEQQGHDGSLAVEKDAPLRATWRSESECYYWRYSVTPTPYPATTTMPAAISIDISHSPLFTSQDYYSSSSSLSQQPLSSSNIVSLLLSRPATLNSVYLRPRYLEKPLPSIPSPISPQAILSLLSQLDQADADVEEQVSRVKEHIREASLLVDTCKNDFLERNERARKKKERVKRETKEVGCDFWLGV